jgi:hypothetical protein
MINHAISVAKNYLEKVCLTLQSLVMLIVNLMQERIRSS